LDIKNDVPLASRTTLELGGAARYFVEATDDRTVAEGLQWADHRGVTTWILGGGSNVVVPDLGLDGLVIRMAQRGLFEVGVEGDEVFFRISAGEPWDSVVERTVKAGNAGIECLSGIPGSAGAVPIQNVGAYGQEASDVLSSVRVLDTNDYSLHELQAEQCELSYRDSFFKRSPDRYVILGITIRLVRDGTPAIRYAELERALEPIESPSPMDVRRAVIALRRSKSMVIDPDDENRRSVGSFFANPIVEHAVADRVAQIAVDQGLISDRSEMPRFDSVEPGHTKLAAGWLIEKSGVEKGERHGAVGVSTKHSLCLVHHGDGTSEALLDLARHVRERVRARFGLTLVPEPTLW
jgi:UDP-N-acetylmuramate dehydrogenase